MTEVAEGGEGRPIYPIRDSRRGDAVRRLMFEVLRGLRTPLLSRRARLLSRRARLLSRRAPVPRLRRRGLLRRCRMVPLRRNGAHRVVHRPRWRNAHGCRWMRGWDRGGRGCRDGRARAVQRQNQARWPRPPQGRQRRKPVARGGTTASAGAVRPQEDAPRHKGLHCSRRTRPTTPAPMPKRVAAPFRRPGRKFVMSWARSYVAAVAGSRLCAQPAQSAFWSLCALRAGGYPPCLRAAVFERSGAATNSCSGRPVVP